MSNVFPNRKVVGLGKPFSSTVFSRRGYGKVYTGIILSTKVRNYL